MEGLSLQSLLSTLSSNMHNLFHKYYRIVVFDTPENALRCEIERDRKQMHRGQTIGHADTIGEYSHASQGIYSRSSTWKSIEVRPATVLPENKIRGASPDNPLREMIEDNICHPKQPVGTVLLIGDHLDLNPPKEPNLIDPPDLHPEVLELAIPPEDIFTPPKQQPKTDYEDDDDDDFDLDREYDKAIGKEVEPSPEWKKKKQSNTISAQIQPIPVDCGQRKLSDANPSIDSPLSIAKEDASPQVSPYRSSPEKIKKEDEENNDGKNTPPTKVQRKENERARNSFSRRSGNERAVEVEVNIQENNKISKEQQFPQGSLEYTPKLPQKKSSDDISPIAKDLGAAVKIEEHSSPVSATLPQKHRQMPTLPLHSLEEIGNYPDLYPQPNSKQIPLTPKMPAHDKGLMTPQEDYERRQQKHLHGGGSTPVNPGEVPLSPRSGSEIHQGGIENRIPQCIQRLPSGQIQYSDLIDIREIISAKENKDKKEIADQNEKKAKDPKPKESRHWPIPNDLDQMAERLSSKFANGGENIESISNYIDDGISRRMVDILFGSEYNNSVACPVFDPPVNVDKFIMGVENRESGDGGQVDLDLDLPQIQLTNPTNSNSDQPLEVGIQLESSTQPGIDKELGIQGINEEFDENKLPSLADVLESGRYRDLGTSRSDRDQHSEYGSPRRLLLQAMNLSSSGPPPQDLKTLLRNPESSQRNYLV